MKQSQELVALQRRVEGWRKQGGGRGSRIPEKLCELPASVRNEVLLSSLVGQATAASRARVWR